eukprot:3158787-Pyramimonas_sp.AAC.1
MTAQAQYFASKTLRAWLTKCILNCGFTTWLDQDPETEISADWLIKACYCESSPRASTSKAAIKCYNPP